MKVNTWMTPVCSLALFLLLFVAAGAPVHAGDWPRFRGADASGVAMEEDLLRAWPEEGPRVVWRRPLGEGFSTVVAEGGQALTLYAVDDVEYAGAFRLADGGEVWRVPLGPKYVDPWGNGPRATPAIDGDAVAVLGSAGHLAMLRRADGTVLWELDLPERFGPARRNTYSAMEAEGLDQGPFFGYCGSPLVADDLVVVYTGAGENRSLVAVDRSSGRTRWTALDAVIADSSPVLHLVHGERQILIAVPGEVVGLSLDGTVRWRHPSTQTPIALPLLLPPDRVFVSAPNEVGAQLFRVVEGQTVTVWEERFMRNNWQSSVAVQDMIVGFDNATLKAFSLDGTLQWAQRGLGKGTLIAAAGLVYVLSDRGTLVLAEVSEGRFQETGRVRVLNAASWTGPALADGKLLLRNHEEMVCLDVRGERVEAAR